MALRHSPILTGDQRPTPKIPMYTKQQCTCHHTCNGHTSKRSSYVYTERSRRRIKAIRRPTHVVCLRIIRMENYENTHTCCKPMYNMYNADMNLVHTCACLAQGKCRRHGAASRLSNLRDGHPPAAFRDELSATKEHRIP